jgi:hypothetical protein
LFKDILVAFVTRETKIKPFFVALGMAKKFESNLTVIECVLREPSKFGFFDTKKEKDTVQKQMKLAQSILKKLEKAASEAGLSIKTKVALTGSISDWLIGYVKDHKTDLLIMDHPHLSDFEESYYEDIIYSITHEVRVPLLLLRS